MTTQLTNIKFELFTAKEHYLAFRQAWKDYINEGNHKPEYVVNGYGGVEKISNLDAKQQLLFCILTEKDLSHVFRPSENPDKENGFGVAKTFLIGTLSRAKEIVDYEKGDYTIPSYVNEDRYAGIIDKHKEYLDDFLKPFGKGVTYEMLSILYRKIKESKLTNKVDSDTVKAA